MYQITEHEAGALFSYLQPLLSRLPVPNPYINDKKHTIAMFQRLEREVEISQPTLRYNKVLPEVYKALARFLELPEPSEEESQAIGSNIGSWSAFPDTVPALQALKKHYKLVILSNIDNDSITAALSSSLKGVEFDAVYTAQDIGSYKPDLANFEYLLKGVKTDLGVEKEQVLHTAQTLLVDQIPAKLMGMHSAWINRDGMEKEAEELGEQVSFTWKFSTLGEMAAAVDEEFQNAC